MAESEFSLLKGWSMDLKQAQELVKNAEFRPRPAPPESEAACQHHQMICMHCKV